MGVPNRLQSGMRGVPCTGVGDGVLDGEAEGVDVADAVAVPDGEHDGVGVGDADGVAELVDERLLSEHFH